MTTAFATRDGANYTYTAGFLTAGGYTVAFTCQGANDDPATDDTLAFLAAANVTVEAGTTVQVDF